MKAIIEIPKGSYYKYEIDKEDGSICIDRVIDIPYPQNYGFIPNTLAPDGDALDVFVISDHPIACLAKVSLDVIGLIRMNDNGISDNKLVCKIKGDLEREWVDSVIQIQHFLLSYKRNIEILGFTSDQAEIRKEINDVQQK